MSCTGAAGLGQGRVPGRGGQGAPGGDTGEGRSPGDGGAQGGPSSSIPRPPAVLRWPSCCCIVGLVRECRAPDVHILPLEPMAMTAHGGWGGGPAGVTVGLELATLHFLGLHSHGALGQRLQRARLREGGQGPKERL